MHHLKRRLRQTRFFSKDKEKDNVKDKDKDNVKDKCKDKEKEKDTSK